MPMLTPSRIAIVVISLTLFSFLYTLGFPSPLAQPSRPIIDHYDHKNVHSEPIIPAPYIPEPTPTPHATPSIHGDRPEEEEDHRWDDNSKFLAEAGSPEPTETGIAEFEKDGGRWDDKDKLKVGEEAKEASAPFLPTTLLTHAVPRPSGVNATAANGTASIPPAVSTEAVPADKPNTKFCKDVHGAPHVMIVLRTSKAEISDKIPAHLKSLLSCVPNFAIFSDHSGSIDGIPVHNVLADIGSEPKRTHDEFREYQIMHADAGHKPDGAKTKELDKWKFLPMVYKAQQLKPDAKFYFFIELDTSLSWTNVLQWINRLDYRIPYYSGAPVFINNQQIAQRGPGIMLSQGAVRRFTKLYDEKYTSDWEPAMSETCCGDLALAQALSDAHVEFYSSWPLMQGEQPSTLDYSHKHWCAPAVSWHHTSPAVLEDMWTVQKAWTAKNGWNKPFLYRDAFESFVAPHVATQKPDWDNLSQDTKIVAPPGRQNQLKDDAEKKKKTSKQSALAAYANLPPQGKFADPPTARRKNRSLFTKHDDEHKEPDWDTLAETFKDAADSAATCQAACESVENCLQWRHNAAGDGECHLGKVMRLGREDKGAGTERWSSGWMVERVEKTKKEWDCKKVEWRFYQ
ncbi:hypothetical protein DE146DRAFT_670564 [Phaeosphaeria sp. MPI-PUGE-AT-0046c]|nr:hypothetical protein DE146DRAFT_670564 [Phaeosphaeria sp. MPI-PUGE-AT-0046c]